MDTGGRLLHTPVDPIFRTRWWWQRWHGSDCKLQRRQSIWNSYSNTEFNANADSESNSNRDSDGHAYSDTNSNSDIDANPVVEPFA